MVSLGLLGQDRLKARLPKKKKLHFKEKTKSRKAYDSLKSDKYVALKRQGAF